MSIILDKVNHEYSAGTAYHVQALKDINLKIESNKIVGLLGKNGSGKSTLFKLTNDLLTLSSGEILIDGKNVSIESKKIVSYLPERTYLDETLTVEKTIDYFADFYSDFDRVKANELFSRLKIDTKSKIKTLSKGTKEKVQLSLVMSRRAKLYLLDEPENSLSPEKQQELIKFLEDSARFFGCQFIIATHSPFLLSMKNAKIYDMDENPVDIKKWTELENVRTYYEFFKKYEREFE